jgi:hypothetical protein
MLVVLIPDLIKNANSDSEEVEEGEVARSNLSISLGKVGQLTGIAHSSIKSRTRLPR